MKRTATIIVLLLSALLAGCDTEEQTTPSYLSIDAVVLDRGNDDVWNHKDAGFFTHLIDAVCIMYHVEGDPAWTTVGSFQLPCRVPILREGVIDTMIIQPVVKQNGIAATRIYYEFYNEITLGHLTLSPDEVLQLDTLHTTYKSSKYMKVKWEEYFSLTSPIKLDSVLLRTRDTVRSGNASGVVRVGKEDKSISFWTHDTIHCPDPTVKLYLEMDYWTDFNLSVGFNNPMYTGGNDEIAYHMTLVPNHGWKKIYINLGNLWSQYNHYPDLRLYFTILNEEGNEGNVYLDNLKVIAM